MNFLAGAVISGGLLNLDCGGAGRTAIAGSPLAGNEVREVVLGVRPQDISVHTAALPRTIAAEVSLVQLLGSEKLVDLDYGTGRQVTAQVKADSPLEAGQKVWIGFDPARLHVFDAASGGNLMPEK